MYTRPFRKQYTEVKPPFLELSFRVSVGITIVQTKNLVKLRREPLCSLFVFCNELTENLYFLTNVMSQTNLWKTVENIRDKQLFKKIL